MKKNIFALIFFLILLIAVLNGIGNKFFLYWKFWWFDIVVHFLGGLWVGLSVLWFCYFSGYLKNLRKDAPFVILLSFLSVLAVGLGWEIFEFVIEVDFSDKYISDTSLDLIMDILGSLIASAGFLRALK